MNQKQMMAMGLDPSLILKAMKMEPDAWQRDLLLSQEQYVLLNCCRQAGKSRTVSALALHKALFVPGSDIVILSSGQRQSSEVFHQILEAYNAIDRPVKAESETQLKMEFANKSRIICRQGLAIRLFKLRQQPDNR
jgi:phage terminase large subunit-like protein